MVNQHLERQTPTRQRSRCLLSRGWWVWTSQPLDDLHADAIRHAVHMVQPAPGRLDWTLMHGEDSAPLSSLLWVVCASLLLVLLITLLPPESTLKDWLPALAAWRLIPLDKYPGVRPIGVGEVPRTIIAKAILQIIGSDSEDAATPLQLAKMVTWATTFINALQTW